MSSLGLLHPFGFSPLSIRYGSSSSTPCLFNGLLGVIYFFTKRGSRTTSASGKDKRLGEGKEKGRKTVETVVKFQNAGNEMLVHQVL